MKLYYLFLTLILLVSFGLSQSSLNTLLLSGKPLELVDEIVTVRDVNGRICGAVEVLSDMDGFSYDSFNGIVKMVDRPGKDLVYLTPDERVLEIYHQGYKPLKIILSDEGIHLRSKVVWRIKIVPEERYISQKGTLIIQTVPAGASIEIDGIPGFYQTSPYRYENITAQPWKIILSKPGYEKYEEIITVKESRAVTFNVRLVPTFAYLKFDPPPTTGNILINDSTYNLVADLPLKVPVGELDIKYTRKYYHDFSTKISVMANDNLDSTVVLHMRPVRKQSQLSIYSSTPGAAIYLDGYQIGKTPLVTTIAAGKYRLEALLEHHRGVKKEIEVTGDNPVNVKLSLTKMGFAKITGTEGASVYINDSYKGKIPLTRDIELAPGDYDLRLEKIGYDTRETSFNIDSEGTEIDITLPGSKNKFYRFAAFGNARVDTISNGFALYIGSYAWYLPPDLLNDIYPPGGYSKKWLQYGLSMDAAYYKNPLVFGASYWLGFLDLNDTNDNNDSLSTKKYYLYAGVTPFVFFEVIYPTIGGMFGERSFKYFSEINGNVTNNYVFSGYFAEVRFKFNNDFIMKFTYLNCGRNSQIPESINIQIGYLFRPSAHRK